MTHFCRSDEVQGVTSIVPVIEKDYKQWIASQPDRLQSWAKAANFKAKPASVCLVPNEAGQLQQVLLGIESRKDFWSFGALPTKLPAGDYQISAEIGADQYQQYLMAWGLGCYQFSRYKSDPEPLQVRCVVPEKIDIQPLITMVESIHWVRDLVNTPTDDLGPSEYAKIIADFASEVGASFSEIVGDQLLQENYPMVHAVGRGSDDQPRLVQLRWGEEDHPKVALVGKGVCFDTGGLNIKTPAGMLAMKKDMGGSAHVLGLAKLIIATNLPIQLSVFIPLVENSVSGASYRPSDVLSTRKGLTVEVGNTDAEGRLILADALTAAASEDPDLIIDFATLTGAARVALGTELPGFFTQDETLAADLLTTGESIGDPIWRLPLYKPYKALLKSKIADICNVASSPYAGAILAALFLQRFVGEDIPWVHFDIMAANIRGLPGRPEGGEAMGLRTVFTYLTKQFSARSSVG